MVLLLLASTVTGQDRPKVEIPFEEQLFTLVADRIQREADGQLLAQGQVIATYSDAVLKANRVTYHPDRRQILVEGDFEITRGTGWLKGSRAEIDVETDTGVIFDAYGFTDEQLFVRAEKITKTGPGLYVAENGYLTACEDAVPKWSFRISKATINLKSSAKFSNTLFRIKQLPLLYFPYMRVPTQRKGRSSGFMLPSTGNSNNKGRRITNRFYLVMGRSADVMIQNDYYSERGFGSGFNLRARPNEVTVFNLGGEFVDDRQGRGGASLEGIGYTTLGNNFRAVADFNLVSNFRFRQTFSDNFFTATRPTEDSRLFLTNNEKSRSFNLLLAREETVFTNRNIVTQATPAVQFRLLGQRLGRLPLHLDLDSSVGGLNRSDALIETPKVSQRLDLFPRVYFSVPLFQGLRLSPGIGIRETFYSDSLTSGPDAERSVSGDSLHRQYFQLSVDLTGWGLSRVYESESGSNWKHLIEPQIRYRWIDGIDNFDRIIRFDALDAIAETNEIEYSIVNRLFVKRNPQGQTQEWMSFQLGQKYFFDPTFGGAIEEGAINQFLPLNSLTGLPYAIGEREFSPVTALVRLTPNGRTSFDIRSDYDTQTGDFRSVSVTGFFRRDWLTLATTYFLTEELIEEIGRSNQIQGRVGLGDYSRGLSAFTSFSYDTLETKFLNHLARVNYFWDCCGVSLEVGGFNLSSRQENQIRFSFFLKGIGSFGTIRRPDNVF